MRYQDLGPDYYERQRDIRRQIAHHVGKLGDLGLEDWGFQSLRARPSPHQGRNPAHCVR
jgi:hypothetical protein